MSRWRVESEEKMEGNVNIREDQTRPGSWGGSRGGPGSTLGKWWLLLTPPPTPPLFLPSLREFATGAVTRESIIICCGRVLAHTKPGEYVCAWIYLAASMDVCI